MIQPITILVIELYLLVIKYSETFNAIKNKQVIAYIIFMTDQNKLMQAPRIQEGKKGQWSLIS